MGTRIQFSFFGDEQINRTLLGIELRTLDASPAFEQIVDSFDRAEARQFNSEGQYGGAPWAPLSPNYAAWKSRHYPGKPILEATGALRRSLTERPLGIERIGPHEAIFGSDIKYGEYHQHGDGHLPARPPVQIPESLRRTWVKIMQRWIIDATRTGGVT